jgi:hypothetical protein
MHPVRLNQIDTRFRVRPDEIFVYLVDGSEAAQKVA